MKKIILIFLLLFLSVSIFGDPAEKYFQRAKEATDENDKIKFYSITLKLKPDYSDALIARAESYFNSYQLGKAEDDLKSYLEKFDISPRTFVLKGKIAQQNGLLDKAKMFYEEALKLNEKDEEANLRKGILLITLGKLKNNSKFYKEAITFLSLVTSNSPHHELALSQASKCYEFFQKYTEAEQAFNMLSKAKPDLSLSFFNLARLQYMNESYESAIKNLDKACELTFKDKTFNIFFSAFRYYIQHNKLNDSVSGEYTFNLFVDTLPSSPITKLFKKKITPLQFLEEELSNDKLNKLSSKRKDSFKAEIYCQAAYAYLIDDKFKEARELFQKALTKELFGVNYYYLAQYELQRLEILEDMKK